MMQVGIFTGYFPYELEATAQKIRKLNFNTVQLDLSFKDIDLSTESDHQGQMPQDSRYLSRPQPADLLHLRLHQYRPSR